LGTGDPAIIPPKNPARNGSTIGSRKFLTGYVGPVNVTGNIPLNDNMVNYMLSKIGLEPQANNEAYATYSENTRATTPYRCLCSAES